MALADALRDMNAYAARGRVGNGPAQPQLHLNATRNILRGSVAHVAWDARRSRNVLLSIVSPGQPAVHWRVPTRGQRSFHGLPVGRHVVVLRAQTARPRGGDLVAEREAVIEVHYPPPSIEIVVPRRITFGESLQISWQVHDARHTEVAVDGQSQEIAPNGTLELHPQRCRPIRLIWHATGIGGETSKRATIGVDAPPVVITVPASVRVSYGDDVAIRYAVTGAASLTLTALDRAERSRPIPLSGRIEIDGIMESERLVLTAIGHDGRTHSKTIALQVGPEPMPSIDDFLEILNGGIDG